MHYSRSRPVCPLAPVILENHPRSLYHDPMRQRDQKGIPAHVAMHIDGGLPLRESLAKVALLAGHLFRLPPVRMLTFRLASIDRILAGSSSAAALDPLRAFVRRWDEDPPGGAALYIPRQAGPLPAPVEDALRAFRRKPSPDGRVLTWLLGYGGRREIVAAAASMAESSGSPGLRRPSFESLLCMAGLPDPDLVILIGLAPVMPDFLLYQSAYAEFHIPPTSWPDFLPRDLDRALADYRGRERRFGRV